MQVQHVLAFVENFSRLLAHGMKNRLTPAVTAVYLLEDDAAMSAQKLKNLADLSMRSLQGALDVLTSLESFSKIQPTPPVSTEILPWFQTLADKHLVEVAITGESLTVQLDRVLWETIVSELLLNVKQHGAAKAQVHWSHEEAGEIVKLKLRIQDSGAGLGKMTAERAMEATRKSEMSIGAGLGLSKALWAAVLLDGLVELSASEKGGVIAEAWGRAAETKQHFTQT